VLRVIKSVLNEANTSIGDLNLIAASVGPGSYSGIRIGLATAFGLSGALSINCVGVSVLDALSLTAESDGNFVAAVGVGKRHVGWNSFEVSSRDRRPASMLVMQSDEEFGSSLEPFGPISVVCDVSLSDRIQTIVPKNVVVVESKQTIAELVGIFASRFPERTSIQPIYLRDQSGLSGQPIIKL
jgi:tRNA threonylcarbamoyl adenosine modification protein YeaZ